MIKEKGRNKDLVGIVAFSLQRLPLDGSLLAHSRFLHLRLGRDGVAPEGLLGIVLPNAVVTALRAEPVIESEVPSRLIGVTPGIPLPLDPEAVRPL